MMRGEIWWVAFGAIENGEIGKTRPSIILSNNAANSALNRIVVVPITSKADRIFPSEVRVSVMGRDGKAMADQITTADKRRLRSKIGTLTPAELAAVEAAVAQHLGIKR